MKRIILAFVILVSYIGVAQHGKYMDGLTPVQVATLRTKKMTLALDLTNKQYDQVYGLYLEKAKIRKAAREDRKATNKKEDRENLSAEEIFTRKNEKLDRRIAHKNKMKTILSKEQYDKWQKMQHKRKQHHKKKKRG